MNESVSNNNNNNNNTIVVGFTDTNLMGICAQMLVEISTNLTFDMKLVNLADFSAGINNTSNVNASNANASNVNTSNVNAVIFSKREDLKRLREMDGLKEAMFLPILSEGCSSSPVDAGNHNDNSSSNSNNSNNNNTTIEKTIDSNSISMISTVDGNSKIIVIDLLPDCQIVSIALGGAIGRILGPHIGQCSTNFVSLAPSSSSSSSSSPIKKPPESGCSAPLAAPSREDLDLRRVSFLFDDDADFPALLHLAAAVPGVIVHFERLVLFHDDGAKNQDFDGRFAQNRDLITLCLHRVYTVFARCLHGVYTVFTPCLHCVYTVFTVR